MHIAKKGLLGLILFKISSNYALDRLSRAEIVIPAVAVGALAGYYLTRPDKKEVPFEQLKITTFLPVTAPISSFVAQEKEAVFKVLKQGEGFLEINKKTYQLFTGIPQEIADLNEPVTIFAGGYNPFGHLPPWSIKNYKAYRGYVALKSEVINGPCIVYESPYSSRTALNFGQEQEVNSFGFLYDNIVQKNKDVEIVLHGVCKGALTQLNFLKNKKNLSNVKAVIVESPMLSFEQVLQSYGVDYYPVQVLSQLIFPNNKLDTKQFLMHNAFLQFHF